VVHHIRERLFELRQQFICLLGVEGFLHALVRVLPRRELRSAVAALRDSGVMEGRHYWRMLQFSFWISLRVGVRKLKKRHPNVSVIDLDDVERKPQHSRHQYRCRDA
jgi:hypothetical protein